jgi:integrase
VEPDRRVKLPRLRQKGNAYYYDTQAKPRRWIALGSNLPAALREYERLTRKGERGTVAAMLESWLWAAHLVRVFGDMRPCDLTRFDVLRYMDECPRTSARAEISMLRQAFERAVRRQEAQTNPCVSVKAQAPKVSERTRYLTDTELAAIHSAGTPLLRVAVDLAYLLALRVNDLCRLRWDDFAEHVQTGKTGARLRFGMSDDLRAVLDDARALAGRVASLTVLSERGRPVTRYRIGDLWRRACHVAGIEDAQLRDVRAKSATDADAAGQDAQKLLGHTTPQTTRRYLRGRQIATVQPVKRRRM